MPGRQGFITNHETYVYQESPDLPSAAFGIDSQDSYKWKLIVSQADDAFLFANPKIIVDSRNLVPDGVDGDITFTPNGVGSIVISNLGVGAALLSTTGAISSSGAGTAGQVLISNGAGVAPSWGSNSGIVWTEVTGATVSLAVDSAYVMNRAGAPPAITATLPAVAAFGSTIIIVGKGSGLWTIAQNAGQTIHFDDMDTTTGIAGSVTAINKYDSIELVCITANTDFVARTSVGNLTVI
jgi:hypothetical protein